MTLKRWFSLSRVWLVQMVDGEKRAWFIWQWNEVCLLCFPAHLACACIRHLSAFTAIASKASKGVQCLDGFCFHHTDSRKKLVPIVASRLRDFTKTGPDLIDAFFLHWCLRNLHHGFNISSDDQLSAPWLGKWKPKSDNNEPLCHQLPFIFLFVLLLPSQWKPAFLSTPSCPQPSKAHTVTPNLNPPPPSLSWLAHWTSFQVISGPCPCPRSTTGWLKARSPLCTRGAAEVGSQIDSTHLYCSSGHRHPVVPWLSLAYNRLIQVPLHQNNKKHSGVNEIVVGDLR